MSSTHSETKEDKRVAFGFWLQDQRARGGWVRHVGRTEAEKYVIGAHWFEAANLRRLYRASYVIHNPDEGAPPCRGKRRPPAPGSEALRAIERAGGMEACQGFRCLPPAPPR